MKTREAIRRRRNIAAMLRAMFILPDGSPNPAWGVRVTGIPDPRRAQREAVKSLACRLRGGTRGDDKARAKSLRRARVEAWAPLAREIVADRPMTRDVLADALRQRLIDLDPFDPLDAELATRDDLCPSGIPSRLRFRQIVASLTDAEWAAWTLPLPNEPERSR